ncbi:galectin-2 isoform X2 [Pelodiscus sinensis]|uniref:galectin-2 isoform X2 n=1 Tax=Pelodiscus sinensis TaxID=13735 RepID=UPI003F6D4975
MSDVIDPGAEGPLLDTEEEEEGSESQEPAGSLPRTRDPRGTPQSRSPVSSEAGEASTWCTTPPAAAARARASRRARNEEEYQRRHLRFMDHQLRTLDHWDLRVHRRSLEALRGLLQSLLDRFPIPPAPPAPAPAPASATPPIPPVPPSTTISHRRPRTCSVARQERHP